MNKLPIQKPDRGGKTHQILSARLSTALCAISLALFLTACSENPADSD